MKLFIDIPFLPNTGQVSVHSLWHFHMHSIKYHDWNHIIVCKFFQVDIHKIKFFYMEDDGGSAVVSAVHPEIKTALRKVILHLDKAYGIKAQKVIISGVDQYTLPVCLRKPEVYCDYPSMWFSIT
jgi:hypothetical protein